MSQSRHQVKILPTSRRLKLSQSFLQNSFKFVLKCCVQKVKNYIYMIYLLQFIQLYFVFLGHIEINIKTIYRVSLKPLNTVNTNMKPNYINRLVTFLWGGSLRACLLSQPTVTSFQCHSNVKLCHPLTMGYHM